MLLFLLKFTACLGILLIFYKVLLERDNAHVFKRYYLLGAIIVSIIIPFITFTTYVDPVENSNQLTELTNITIEEKINYFPILFLSIYALGFVLFTFKFIRNIFQIGFRIKSNKKIISDDLTNVLLLDKVIPHTFLSYIFYYKKDYEKNEIPKEVILHEETHAKQKHSIDILFIELLQVIFWFHPLIYIYNKSIKLNHEFLADQAVLSTGVSASNYQNILLTFSSNANYSPLANAINYSLIKKRFTVMKTKRTKKSIWLKCLLFLPLLSLLLYSFSTKVEIEKEQESIEEISYQKGATKKQIAEYNKLARKYNTQEKDNIIVRKKDVERLNYIFNLMTKAQKLSAEPFPYFPPPPKDKIVRGINDEGENVLPPPPPPPPAPEVIKGVNDKDPNMPPPPPPPAPKKDKMKKKVKEAKKKEKTLAIKNENLLLKQKTLNDKRLALNDAKKREVKLAESAELKRKLVQERKELIAKRELISIERKKELELKLKEKKKNQEL